MDLVNKLSNNWIFLSAFAAVTFGLGDFIVVLSKDKKMDVLLLYLLYNVIVGAISMLFILGKKDSLKDIGNFTPTHWLIVASFSMLYFVAYMSHFMALQKAPNPGYSNSLIMFHVVVLTLLATLFLNKPINGMTVLGIVVSFVGAWIITTYAGV